MVTNLKKQNNCNHVFMETTTILITWSDLLFRLDSGNAVAILLCDHQFLAFLF